MTYDFDEKLAEGERWEAFIDALFAPGFDISRATYLEQTQDGIDRHYTHRKTGQHMTVEYKTDLTASRTHNAFVETISVDTQNKPGWAYKSKAQYLFYLIPGDGILYLIRFPRLRHRLERWSKKYPTQRIPNKGYHTVGLIVPLAEFERCADMTVPV